VHDGLKWANSKGVHSVVDLCEGEVGVDGNGGGGDLGLTMGFGHPSAERTSRVGP